MKPAFARNSQLAIWNILKIISDMPKVEATYSAINVMISGTLCQDINLIKIRHEKQFVPDFDLEWCPSKQHFRTYIYIGDGTGEKKRAAYSILVVGSRLEAVQFIDFYGFICKNRANNKES